jgi:hypothetical protein
MAVRPWRKSISMIPQQNDQAVRPPFQALIFHGVEAPEEI